MVEGGITVESVDTVIAALKEYRDNIVNYLNQAKEQANTPGEDEEYSKAAKTYVDSVSKLLDGDLIKRLDATISAIEQARDEYQKKENE